MDKTTALLILGGVAAYIIYNEYNMETIYIDEPGIKTEIITEAEFQELEKSGQVKKRFFNKKGILIGGLAILGALGATAYFIDKEYNYGYAFEKLGKIVKEYPRKKFEQGKEYLGEKFEQGKEYLGEKFGKKEESYITFDEPILKKDVIIEENK